MVLAHLDYGVEVWHVVKIVRSQRITVIGRLGGFDLAPEACLYLLVLRKLP